MKNINNVRIVSFCMMLVLMLTVLSVGSLPSALAQGDKDVFVDPLYGYSIAIPSGWNVEAPEISALSDNKVLYGVTIIENFDPVVAESQGSKPDHLKIQIGLGPMTNPDFFDWIQKRIWDETESPDFLDFDYHSTIPEPTSLGSLSGYKFIMTSQGLNSSVMEIDLLINNDVVVSIGLTPSDSPSIPEALILLSTLDFSNTNISALDFHGNPKSSMLIADLLESSSLHIDQQDQDIQALAIHPPGWGSEAPDSPITLYMPFHDGETWQVGGAGYFYGDGTHSNYWNDYYATDWNRTAGDDLGKDVLPVAGGNVIQRQISPCPTAGYGCYVKIDHGNGITTLYGHLSTVLRDMGGVNHWDVIGQVGSSGNSTSPHLHLQFRQNGYSTCRNNGNTCPNGESPASQQSSKPSPMSTQQGTVQLNDGYTYVSNNKNNENPSPCPTLSGEVRLYDLTNCGGGYAYVNGTGLWSVASVFNDQAESIAIPSGWSARLYQNDNENSNESACFSGTDTNLNDNTFANGGVVGNSTTWMRVYDNTSCSGVVSPPGAPSLSSPGNGSNNPYNYDLNFQWNSSSGATEYLLEWWGGPYSAMQPCGWSSSTSCHVGTVAAGNTYSWHVKARNSAGESGWSSTWTFTIQPNIPNTPPNFRVSSSTQTSITIAWDDVSNEIGYKIYEWNGSSFVYLASVGANVTSYTETRSTCGWDEFYEVSAYNGNGESDHASWVHGYTQACPPPAPSLSSPGNGSNLPNNYDLNFQWNSSSGATEYLVEWWGGSYSTMQPCGWSSSTSCHIGTVAAGNTYSWHVKARNSAGESGWSSTWTFTIQSPPGAFNKSSPTNGSTFVSSPPTISWTASSGTTSYEYCIDSSNNNSCDNSWISNGTSTSKVITSGLLTNQKYYWNVRAKNVGGETYANSSIWWSFILAPMENPSGSDLTILDLSTSPSSPRTNDDIDVYIDLVNQSSVAAGGFYIHFYIDDQPEACFDYGPYWRVFDGLAGNNSYETWGLIMFSAGTFSPGVHTISAFVDSGCQQYETNERNNIASYTFTVSAPSVAAPTHDDFGSAKDIGSIRYTDVVDVRGATRASDDPSEVGCGYGPGMDSVWYKFTPPVNTAVYLDTIGSDYDTIISVWTGSRGNLTPIICHDDVVPGVERQSAVQVNLIAGTTYYIKVSEWSWLIDSVTSLENDLKPEELNQSDVDIIGLEDGQKTPSDVTAQAGGTLNFHVTYAAEKTSWYGSAVISADRNVVAVGRPHIGSEVTSYGGFSSGSLTQYVPMLFKQMWGSYDSALYIQNADPSNTANISIKFYDSNGTLNCTKADTISAQSSKGYWLPSETCLPANWYGGVVVTADRNIVAVGRPHIGNQVMTYNGFASGGSTMYVPMLFKRMWGSYDSAFYVQNTDPTNTANVTIKFYDPAGVLNCTKTDSIPRLSSHGYWLPDETCLPANWYGGVVVTADRAIVAVGRPHLGSEVTTYNGFAAGSTNMYAPMMFKDASGGSYDSALYVQNVHATNTANVTIKFYNASGGLTCTKTDTILPGSSKGYWLPDESCLGSSWTGSVKVESSQPVVVIGRPHLGSSVTAYDGIGSGGTSVSVPMLFKQMWGSYDSALYIENVDPGNTANVTTRFYDVNGNLSCTKTDTIGPLATLSYWLPSLTCSP